MVVMNDRPQGGTSYKDGRIELMLIRQSNTQDELGIWEAMKDWSSDGQGANVSALFHLAFTNNREQLYRIIQKRHVLNLNPPIYFHSMAYKTKQPMPAGTITIEKPPVLASNTF
jgi:hypothetical protein